MPLKPKIYYSVPGLSISKRVATEFRDIIDINLINNDIFTLIAFPGMKGESSSIVSSKTIKKALKKALDNNKNNEKIVVVAHNFTDEAINILCDIKAIVFSKRDYYWSDESLRRISEK